MKIIRGVFVLIGGLALSAVPFWGGEIPVIHGALISSRFHAWGTSLQAEAQAPTAAAPEPGAHMDHKPKHGGLFFMSLDNRHHLEGVLLAPGIFRVYLYDDHTRPLKAEETRQASGTVQIGDSEDAPKINLRPGRKKETLEASLGDRMKFPVSLTLLVHLPGMPADAKPELFNFTFTGFTDEQEPGSCSPMANMPNMRC
jgi:hypothetical protein